MSFLISDAWAEAPAAAAGPEGGIMGLLFPIGLILIQLLKNGLALTGVTGDATIVVIGTVLILSTLVNSFVQRRFSAV